MQNIPRICMTLKQLKFKHQRHISSNNNNNTWVHLRVTIEQDNCFSWVHDFQLVAESGPLELLALRSWQGWAAEGNPSAKWSACSSFPLQVQYLHPMLLSKVLSYICFLLSLSSPSWMKGFAAKSGHAEVHEGNTQILYYETSLQWTKTDVNPFVLAANVSQSDYKSQPEVMILATHDEDVFSFMHRCRFSVQAKMQRSWDRIRLKERCLWLSKVDQTRPDQHSSPFYCWFRLGANNIVRLEQEPLGHRRWKLFFKPAEYSIFRIDPAWQHSAKSISEMRLEVLWWLCHFQM